MMNVLIIGSTGYMGKSLARELERNGIRVVGASSTDGTGIDPVTGLLPTEYKIPKGISTVVYMAQSPHYRDSDCASHVLSVNVISPTRAALAARAAGVERFIYISTGTVYAHSFLALNELSPLRHSDWYSLSKIQGEQAVQMFAKDMKVHVVRPFGIYGPGQSSRLVPNILKSILDSRPITLQGCDNESNNDGLKISLCYIDDANKCLLSIIKHGGEKCLNLGGESAFSIREIANELGALVNKPPIFLNSTEMRSFDCIADVGLLMASQNISFTPLGAGLAKVVDAYFD